MLSNLATGIKRPAEVDWKLLSDLIEHCFGLVFDDTRREILESRLSDRLRALHLDTFKDYYHYLLYHPDRHREFTEVAIRVTNGESYFFREHHHFEILRDHVLQQIVPGLNGRPLRILSAGCSSGQEPYSISMVLHEAAVRESLRGWEIHACDINPLRLSEAWEAEYGHSAVRSCDPEIIDRYFSPVGDRLKVKPAYRIGARFFEANLTDLQADLGMYDIIFCRNVLIYFSDQAFRKAIELFSGHLVTGGFLFLGHSESLINKTTDFQPVCTGGKVIYRKTEV